MQAGFDLEKKMKVLGKPCVVVAEASGYLTESTWAHPGESDCFVSNISIVTDDDSQESLEFCDLPEEEQTRVYNRLADQFYDRLREGA